MLIGICLSTILLQGESFPLLGKWDLRNVVNEGVVALISVGGERVCGRCINGGSVLGGCDGVVSRGYIRSLL